MRKCALFLVIVAGTWLSVSAGVTVAQQSEPPAPNADQQPAQQRPANPQAGLDEESATRLAHQQGLIRLDRALDQPVQTPDGEAIGTISDLAIDTQRGQAVFVVLTLGEWFGMGGQQTAVPFQAFEQSAEREALITRVSKDQLEKAPTFQRGDTPDMTERAWAKKTSEHFGYQPYWTQGVDAEPAGQPQPGEPEQPDAGIAPPEPEGAAEAQPRQQPAQPERARQAGEERVEALPILTTAALLDQPVNSPQGRSLGTLQDMIVDMREGRVAFVVLSTANVERINGDYAMAPFSAFQYDPAREAFRLDASSQTIDSLAFANDNWPDITNEQWAANVHQQFNREPYWQVFGYGGYLVQERPLPQPAEPSADPRQPLQQAGVPGDEIDQFEQAGYPRQTVEDALLQAYLDQGLSEQEARTRAAQTARQVEARTAQLRQQQQQQDQPQPQDGGPPPEPGADEANPRGEGGYP